MEHLDPRIAAALQLHKPTQHEFVTLASMSGGALSIVVGCDECEGDYPCDTASALGVMGEPDAANTLAEALTWWWQAHGLDLEAAEIAAVLEAA